LSSEFGVNRWRNELPCDNGQIDNFFTPIFFGPQRSMHAGNVSHPSGNRELVSMESGLFSGFSGIFAQAQFGSLFALGQYGGDR
jgi:hypothetical protein